MAIGLLMGFCRGSYQDALRCTSRVLNALRARNELRAPETALLNIERESNSADRVASRRYGAIEVSVAG